MEEKADLARDVTRLRLAQSKLAAAERKAPVFRVSTRVQYLNTQSHERA